MLLNLDQRNAKYLEKKMIFNSEQEYFKIHEKKQGALRLGFGSTFSQSYRYGVLTKEINLKNKTAILIGCGEGAGVPFLQSKHCEKIYGFDILSENIEIAKNRYPDLRKNFFLIKNTLEIKKYIKKTDWIFASGTWNVKTKRKYEKVKELLELSSIITEGIATNFTTNVGDQDDCHNFSPIKILDMFLKKFKKWKMDYSYFKNDFSIWGIDPI